MTETKRTVKIESHQTDNTPAALTPDQAHELLGGNLVVSRSTFYAAIASKQIPHLRVGRRRIIIPRAAFFRWLESGGFSAEAIEAR